MNELSTIQFATLMITLDGATGELAEQVQYDTPENEVRRMATEAVAGGVPGIDAQEMNFTDFVVERLPERDGLPRRIHLRPKTEFGEGEMYVMKIPLYLGHEELVSAVVPRDATVCGVYRIDATSLALLVTTRNRFDAEETWFTAVPPDSGVADGYENGFVGFVAAQSVGLGALAVFKEVK